MSYWPWWVGALALATVPVVHWLGLQRMFAVSGRFTALNEWVRTRGWREPDEEMSADELAEALRAATAQLPGGDCATPAPAGEQPMLRAPATVWSHLIFFAAVAAGGFLSAWSAGDFPASSPGTTFTQIFGTSPIVTALVLGGGGILVGFGTRMAGGCTSGHGLCGTSRLQPGSILATACFFGAGVAVSFLLARLP